MQASDILLRVPLTTTFPSFYAACFWYSETILNNFPNARFRCGPEQAYFSDGIIEALITDLAKLSGLFVIARISVLTYLYG